MAGDIHLVPLSPQAVALLEQIHAITGYFDLVFTSDARSWKPMSENTVNSALRNMGYDTKTKSAGMASGPWRAVPWWNLDCGQRPLSSGR